jgi:cytoskeletal protein RodZ
MKMRWWMGVLLLLNMLTLAWQWDAFARWGWGPNVQREPERLQHQIRPEAMQITMPSQEASAPQAIASEATARTPATSESTAPKAHAPSAADAGSAAAPVPAKTTSQ